MAERFERLPVQYFPKTPENPGTVPLLEHTGSDGRTITKALSDQSDYAQTERKPTQRKTDAVDTSLVDTLSQGPIWVTDLETLSADEGFTSHQVTRSRQRVGARSRRVEDKWRVEL